MLLSQILNVTETAQYTNIDDVMSMKIIIRKSDSFPGTPTFNIDVGLCYGKLRHFVNLSTEESRGYLFAHEPLIHADLKYVV